MSYEHILTDDEKTELLRIARATLREYLHTGRIPPGKPHRDCLVAEAAVFVTLHRGEALRGCIGTQLEVDPLYKSIQKMAVAAAKNDPRFDAVDEDELDDLTIEISVLGERRTITGASDIEVGKHGLSVQFEGQRGLLLPQVATENEWDADAFLERVCTKAGLPADTWQADGAVVETFTAQVFNEVTHPARRR
jgi:AmmeMemoRadiSam system protein A